VTASDRRHLATFAVLCGLALALAAVRIAGHTEVRVGRLDLFQPAAHILAGALLFGGLAHGCRSDRIVLALGGLLSAVELACFLLGVGD
jgi:hypothetical protein